ncbi:hypothetical protein ABZ401_19130 [Streptomyces sp. NPDC005892]|uniref:hypothetical protein n=1 Tax=Streptomyces sp. NPDC005892 TaxID=3155593 RepID=UPI0034063097
MRPITGTDVTDFYSSRYDLLVLTAAGEFDHIDYTDVTSSSYDDGRATAYDYVTTEEGEAQVLLERSTIEEGEWFPNALNDNGDLDPAAANDMAAIINNDGILPSLASKAIQAGEDWKKDDKAAQESAVRRAAAVTEIVAFCGGNQSQAGRVLGLDQSTVNKLVTKHRRAAASMPA